MPRIRDIVVNGTEGLRLNAFSNLLDRGGLTRQERPAPAHPVIAFTKDAVQELRRLLTAEQRFGDAKAVEHKFGLKRSHLYKLMRQGDVVTKSIVQPGRKRGKRLFDLKSVEEFLDRQTTS